MAQRRELITWDEVSKLIDLLLPQFEKTYNVMIMITRGGIVPGGMLAEAMDIQYIFTASVDFPAEEHFITPQQTKFLTWPKFLQFPEEKYLAHQNVLIVDDVWGSGRTITAVKNRVVAADGNPSTCVLHFNPYRNLFGNQRPDYYGAITDAHIVYPWESDRGFRSRFITNIH